MLNLLALLLLTLSIFLFAVGIYSFIAKISVAEARDRVVNFIKESFALQSLQMLPSSNLRLPSRPIFSPQISQIFLSNSPIKVTS